MKRRLSAAVTGVATLAATVGITLGGAIAAHAATTTPPYEPDPNAVSNGYVTLYDAAGNQIQTGSTNSQPFATYAVGSKVVHAGDTSAELLVAQPSPTTNIANWNVDVLTNFTNYPVPTSAPSNIQTLSQTQPVATGFSTDQSLNQFIAVNPNTKASDPNTAYQDLYQLRLKTRTPNNVISVAYDAADVLVNETANTWQQVYPAYTATTLSASPTSPATSGQTVTFTATETPAVAGAVQFVIDGANTGSPVPVDSTGVATYSTSTLSNATHTVAANFVPSGTGVVGSSATTSYVVQAPAIKTTTTLALGGSYTQAGQPATLTSTVTAADNSQPAGSVAFTDGATTLGTVQSTANTTPGTYVLSLPSGFAAGNHNVIATFTPATTAYNGSASAAQSFYTQAAQPPFCQQSGSACTDTQYIQATVPVGTLVINTPYTQTSPLNLGTLALTSDAHEFTVTAPFKNIVITDTRSGSLPYTASASASKLSDGGSNPGSTISSENVGLTGLVVTPGTGFVGTLTPVNNAAAEPAVAPGDTGSKGLGGSAAHTIATADHGTGTVTLNGNLTLNAPTSVEAGTFLGTITFTVG